MKTTKWSFSILAVLLAFAIGVSIGERPVQAQFGGSNGFTFSHISTATNTLAKSANGTLHTIIINGGTLTGVITVVDTSAANCTGGTTIAVIAQPQVSAQDYDYDIQFLNGLCITTAAAVDATVSWR
jgi:hypothetical protein